MNRITTTAYGAQEQPMGTTWTFGTTWSFSRVSARVLGLVAVVAVAGALMAPPQQHAVQVAGERIVASADQLVDVIVRAVTGSDGTEAEQSVLTLGGEIGHHLGIVGGFVAKVPASRIDDLQHAPGVQSVTSNSHVNLLGSVGQGWSAESQLSHVRSVTGTIVPDMLGIDGSQIRVALVDTGVADVQGLPKVTRGPNLGGGTKLDGYGHGTHLAGIIAGRDGGMSPELIGLADDARVVSVKSASDDGSTDLATVLAAMDWVLAQKAEMKIRVINLSLGVPAGTDYRTDILSVAVEKLWSAGIVVVVAGGNSGAQAGSPLTSPATDPYVIAVGSADTKGTNDYGDDTVQSFSPRGSAARRVDVVAPGQSLVSLKAPGSLAENYPLAFVGTRFIKGTGTSQSAAVVSGVVASLLEARPTLTPDQVKAILRSSATRLPGADSEGQGSGLVNLGNAILAANPGAAAAQSFPPATGPTPAGPPTAPVAPQEAPPVVDANGDGIPDDGVTGGGAYDFERNGPPTAPAADGSDPSHGWTGGTWSSDGSTFSGGTWSGGTWSGGTWSGGTWSGGTWSGGTWSGGTWSGGTWSGGTWSGGTWSGGTWSGGTWSGGTWSGGTWSGGTWSGGTWSGGTWSGGTWSGGTWSGGTWSGNTSTNGGPWTGGTWSGGTWSGGTWSGGTWSGGTWSGGTWSGGTWSGGTWSGGTWSGSGGTWSGGTWSGGTWSGGTWSGGTWSGGTWSGGTWSGGTWSGGTWSGGTWSGGTWSGGTWSGGTWSGGTWSGGTWSGGTWSGGSWSADAWTGTTWS